MNKSLQSGWFCAAVQRSAGCSPAALLALAVLPRSLRQVSRTTVRLGKPFPNSAPPCTEFVHRSAVPLRNSAPPRLPPGVGTREIESHQHSHLRLVRRSKHSVKKNCKEGPDKGNEHDAG